MCERSNETTMKYINCVSINNGLYGTVRKIKNTDEFELSKLDHVYENPSKQSNNTSMLHYTKYTNYKLISQ